LTAIGARDIPFLFYADLSSSSDTMLSVTALPSLAVAAEEEKNRNVGLNGI
jgi:hypothetical protein